MHFDHPAIDHLLNQIDGELVIGQIVLRKDAANWLLLHLADSQADPAHLKACSISELRRIASHNSSGRFRPIKSAPDLMQGWWFRTGSRAHLVDALDAIYPGFVADYYHFSQSGSAAAQTYWDYSQRQTGMYRVTQLISPEDLSDAVSGCCDARFCLKSRQWSGPSIPPDPPAQPSIIPCLEPCAPFVELARIQAKSSQSPQITTPLSERDFDALNYALGLAIQNPPDDLREADVYNIRNPRRLLILLAKIKRLQHSQTHATSDSVPTASTNTA